MARARTGQLVQSPKTKIWSARVTKTLPDGLKQRVMQSLDTTSKALAKQRLDRLLASDDPTPAEATRAETFAEASDRIVNRQKIRTKSERLHRIRKFALEELGALDVTQIGRANVRAVLQGAADKGYSKSVLRQIRTDLSSVFSDLLQDDTISLNPCTGVKLPESAKDGDERERARLSDAEFVAFLEGAGENPAAISGELVMMAVTSRCLGGARTSDLFALDWSGVDWQARTVRLERQKTRAKGVRWQTYEIPADLEAFPRAWHEDEGKPTSGPIFPVRKGARAGERREGKFSYAEDLRQALRLAWGIDRIERVPTVRKNGRPDSRKRVVQARSSLRGSESCSKGPRPPSRSTSTRSAEPTWTGPRGLA